MILITRTKNEYSHRHRPTGAAPVASHYFFSRSKLTLNFAFASSSVSSNVPRLVP